MNNGCISEQAAVTQTTATAKMRRATQEFSTNRRTFFSRCVGLGLFTATAGKVLIGNQVDAQPQPPRRQSIEAMDASKLEKLEGAIKEMMDRSSKNPKDPKGWLANAEPHSTFCAQPGRGGANQIHYCYWFLPWHRAYLSVTEKKIREIAADSSLTLPYWNWTVNRRIPSRFSRAGSALANAVRFTPDRDLSDDEVDYLENDPALKRLGVGALAASKFEASTSVVNSPLDFARELLNSFGGLARPNGPNVYRNGRIEGTPHGSVHVYVGGENELANRVGDMTDFARAGRDPIFFAHHGNLDRLWELWRSTGTHRATEPSTPDFVNHRFAFPWLDGSSIQITVAETLDTSQLGYAYDTLDVFGDSPPAPAMKPEGFAQARRLAPIISSDIRLPAVPEAISTQKARYLLVLEGVSSPERALSAGVYVASSRAPESVQILVGSLSVVKNGARFQAPNDVLLFDITAAVSQLNTSDIKVLVIPSQIGKEQRTAYRPLRYKAMRVVVD